MSIRSYIPSCLACLGKINTGETQPIHPNLKTQICFRALIPYSEPWNLLFDLRLGRAPTHRCRFVTELVRLFMRTFFQHVPCVKLCKPFCLITPSIYFSCFFLVLNIFLFQFSLSHDIVLLKWESPVITIRTYHITIIIVFARRLYVCKRYISNNTGPILSTIR